MQRNCSGVLGATDKIREGQSGLVAAGQCTRLYPLCRLIGSAKVKCDSKQKQKVAYRPGGGGRGGGLH